MLKKGKMQFLARFIVFDSKLVFFLFRWGEQRKIGTGGMKNVWEYNSNTLCMRYWIFWSLLILLFGFLILQWSAIAREWESFRIFYQSKKVNVFIEQINLTEHTILFCWLNGSLDKFSQLVKIRFFVWFLGSDSFSPIRDGAEVRFPEENLDNQIISMINATISAPLGKTGVQFNHHFMNRYFTSRFMLNLLA